MKTLRVNTDQNRPVRPDIAGHERFPVPDGPQRQVAADHPDLGEKPLAGDMGHLPPDHVGGVRIGRPDQPDGLRPNAEKKMTVGPFPGQGQGQRSGPDGAAETDTARIFSESGSCAFCSMIQSRARA